MSISFRSPQAQAQHIAKQLAAHGVDRHTHKSDGLIHSLGTERSTKDALTGFCGWLKNEARGDLLHATRQDCVDYLHQRSADVGQSAVNADRQALNRLLSVTTPGEQKLPSIRSELKTILSGRAYTAAQVTAIADHQSDRHKTTTLLYVQDGIHFLPWTVSSHHPGRARRSPRSVGCEHAGINGTDEGREAETTGGATAPTSTGGGP